MGLFRTLGLAAMLTAGLAQGQEAKITIAADQPTIKVSPTLYGIFFEEINRSGEGGLFSELIQNRSFEDSKDATPAWQTWHHRRGDAVLSIDTSKPLNPKNPQSLKVEVKGGQAGVMNLGFNGIPVKIGQEFSVSLYARGEGSFDGPLTVLLENSVGRMLGSANIEKISGDWKQYKATIKCSDTDSSARLVISSRDAGVFYLDMVSLMPAKGWAKDASFRADLATLVADMKPSFMRFPGGCWVEGDTMATSYRWKDTIGPVEERKSNHNLWRYMCGNYVGYHEYLQFCEDIGAEPLFVINCGMSHREVVPMEQMQEYVQDALDAIEYANGPADSKWGSLRAKAGHPAPFNLRLMEIGNENGGKPYDERYALFYDAIKAKYPAMELIACVWGGTPKSRKPEIIDEHYYESPAFFIRNASRYDRYDRKGPQIYVGEYAVTKGCAGGNLKAAIGEAAFMTGMERNSDVVKMSSYAPLLANVSYKVWHPNAINFDNSRSYGTPSYYVQQMFSQNRPDQLVKMQVEATSEPVEHGGKIGVGTWRTNAEFKDIEVTSPDGKVLLAAPGTTLDGWQKGRGEWAVKDGAIQQTSDADACFLTTGDVAWKEYTLSLKARKISGDEGFFIRFHSVNDDDYAVLNLGGWGNTRHQVEFHGGAGDYEEDRAAGKIETGKWYDIRLKVTKDRIKAFLDDKPVIDMPYPDMRTQSLLAVAGKAGDDLIVKVVNVSNTPQPTSLAISGVRGIQSVRELQLTGSPDDENSLENPTKVSPKSRTIDVTSSDFKMTFPPNSVTILRAKVK